MVADKMVRTKWYGHNGIIIIIIKLSFIARLNKNNLAQKRVTEKCLIITQFE